MLNSGPAARYHEDDYVIPNFRLGADVLDEIKALHDVYLLHGSEANHSDKPRRGMTMRFMPAASLFDRELASESPRPRRSETNPARRFS